MPTKLIFIHGFLGCNEDWDGVIHCLRDDFECCARALPLKEALDGIYVGYSMGGRIALSLNVKTPLILISTHPGLESEEEKRARWQTDQEWIFALRTEPFEKVLERWYAQPLFATIPLKKREAMLKRRWKEDPKKWAALLERYSLANQKPARFPEKTLYLFGEEDLKYAALSRRLPAHVYVESIKGCGHALLIENPSEVAKRIKAFVERYG